MSASYAWSYNLTVNGNVSAVFTVATSTTAVNGHYAVTGISGTFNGQAITGIVASGGYDSNDEVLGLTSASYYKGLDHLGLAFTIGTGSATGYIDIYANNMGSNAASLNVDEGTLT